jgi:hypothetical protein
MNPVKVSLKANNYLNLMFEQELLKQYRIDKLFKNNK